MSNDTLNIIYQDDDILIVNKPSGTLTIPDRFDLTIPSIRTIAENQFEKIFIVHRLDRDTSGILLLAKNADAHRDLSLQFENLSAKRIYHAVTEQVIHQDSLKIDLPLMPDPRHQGRTIPSARGKESLSIVNVKQRFKHSTLVEVDLVTGRHHQIRVHLSAVGYPLLVDELYGNNKDFFLSSIKRKFNLKKNDTENPIISRVSMHAYSLTFVHPVTKEEMTFTAEYPKDFSVLLKILNKYA